MSYHPDHRTNDIILCVINDGDGSQCGYSYEQRIALGRAKFRLFEFRYMAREYIRYASRTFGTPHPERMAAVNAGNYLQEYYEELADEIDAPERAAHIARREAYFAVVDAEVQS